MANQEMTLHTRVEEARDDIFFWQLKSSKPWSTEEHAHSKGQLFSLQSGLAIVETAAGIWMLLPNRCGWIPPFQLHALRSCGKISGWSIYLDSSLSQHLPPEPCILSLSPLLQQIVFRISDWEQNPPQTIAKEHLLTVLCDEIQNAENNPLHLPMPEDVRLRGLVEEMARQPETEHDLDFWSRFSGMSKRSLLRNFQKETGMTLGAWNQQVRILVSLEKLSEGNSVTAAAQSVGYNSLSGFIRAFKRVVGMTPLAYTRSQQ